MEYSNPKNVQNSKCVIADLIFVIFSPHRKKLAQFLSTQKCVNCDKTDFATKCVNYDKTDFTTK